MSDNGPSGVDAEAFEAAGPRGVALIYVNRGIGEEGPASKPV